MKRTCKQCGAEFTLSEDEIAFYRSKNLHLPKRCEKCRKENRAKAGGEMAGQTAGQVFRPYYGKKDGGIKRWVVAAAVFMLLAVCIGAFCAGWLFKGAGSDAVYRDSAEIAADTAQDTQPEISGETEDIPADTVQDMQPEVSGEAEDVPADTSQDTQPEVSGEAEDVPADTPQKTPEDTQTSKTEPSAYTYSFRKEAYLQEHFEKHGNEFGYTSADEYLAGANRVIVSPDALHKLEAEDGDDVYYLESTNEFVIVSKDGYIRTYFKPNDGKAYFDRQ